jgi:hypothetical protein
VILISGCKVFVLTRKAYRREDALLMCCPISENPRKAWSSLRSRPEAGRPIDLRRWLRDRRHVSLVGRPSIICGQEAVEHPHAAYALRAPLMLNDMRPEVLSTDEDQKVQDESQQETKT